MTKIWKYTFGFLLLVISLLVVALAQAPDSYLHIIACDVGQGDAILVALGSTQILTDGGPDKSVLDCLGKYMPFWDRKIELVVLTHPDADHATGLISVFQNYKVDKVLINPINPGTSTYQALENEVGGRGIPVVNPTAGMKLRLGLIYLDVVSPTEQMLNKLNTIKEGDNLAKYSIVSETNYYSISYVLSFKSFKGIFLGDIPPEVSDTLAESWEVRTVQYIKIPHHGSINGITENFLKKLMPKIAVISVGKNPWGLPKEDILNLLSKYGVKVYRTDKSGSIEVVTDGEKYWMK